MKISQPTLSTQAVSGEYHISAIMLDLLQILLKAIFNLIFVALKNMCNEGPSRRRPMYNICPDTKGNQSLMAAHLDAGIYDILSNMVRFYNTRKFL